MTRPLVERGFLKEREQSNAKVHVFSKVYTNKINICDINLFSDALSLWVAEICRGAGTFLLQSLFQPQRAINNQGWDLMSFLHVYRESLTLPSPCMGGLIYQSKLIQLKPTSS